MPDEGGACRACKSANRSCYFLPRSVARMRVADRNADVRCRQKCGRVPRKDSDRRHQSEAMDGSESPSIAYSNGNMPNAFQTVDHTGIPTTFAQFGPGYLTPAMQMGEPGFMDENMGFPFHDAAGDKYLTSSDHGSRTSLSSSSNDSARMVLTKSHASLQNLDWQLTQVQSTNGLTSEAHQKLFTRLLHECHQMQIQTETLLSTGLAGDGTSTTKAVLQSTILSIDTICHSILEVAGNNVKEDITLATLSDSKLMSVTMAATFTVLEICEVLAANPTSASQGPDYTLMWKRLDLNLTQVRVALQRMLQIGGPFSTVIRQAITRAKVLDNRIKSTVQEGYSDWEDGL